MPTYEFQCQECKHEWEDYMSITAPDPEACPKCQHTKPLRLCSLGSKGVVELTGQDLVDKLKSDAQGLKKDAAAKEKVYANLLGEDKYHALQTRMDRQKSSRR
jgi:putative FmdB family regulatory protein